MELAENSQAMQIKCAKMPAGRLKNHISVSVVGSEYVFGVCRVTRYLFNFKID